MSTNPVSLPIQSTPPAESSSVVLSNLQQPFQNANNDENTAYDFGLLSTMRILSNSAGMQWSASSPTGTEIGTIDLTPYSLLKGGPRLAFFSSNLVSCNLQVEFILPKMCTQVGRIEIIYRPNDKFDDANINWRETWDIAQQSVYTFNVPNFQFYKNRMTSLDTNTAVKWPPSGDTWIEKFHDMTDGDFGLSNSTTFGKIVLKVETQLQGGSLAPSHLFIQTAYSLSNFRGNHLCGYHGGVNNL